MSSPSPITHTLDPAKWIDNYSDYLFRYTIIRINDHEISKDLVQETFFSGLKSAKNFEGKATGKNLANFYSQKKNHRSLQKKEL